MFACQPPLGFGPLASFAPLVAQVGLAAPKPRGRRSANLATGEASIIAREDILASGFATRRLSHVRRLIPSASQGLLWLNGGRRFALAKARRSRAFRVFRCRGVSTASID